MRFYSDFHSHTVYGDGKNTPAEMAKAAFRLGLTDYGISEHGFLANYAYSETGTFGMDDKAFCRYLQEMETLKDRYKGRMRLYIGVEQDGMGPSQKAEYTIGSTHQLVKNGEYVMVDESEEILVSAVNRLWKGDWYGFAADYFRQERKIVELTSCDIIGHFDLITKFNQDFRHFDETCDAYLEPALQAMRELNKAHVLFEINTGAISRGYRKEPYPSPVLLRELKAMGGRIMFNSDSHQAGTQLWKFQEAADIARSCGFEEHYVLAPEGGYKRLGL